MEQENTQEQVTREEATTLDEMSVEDSFNLVLPNGLVPPETECILASSNTGQ